MLDSIVSPHPSERSHHLALFGIFLKFGVSRLLGKFSFVEFVLIKVQSIYTFRNYFCRYPSLSFSLIPSFREKFIIPISENFQDTTDCLLEGRYQLCPRLRLIYLFLLWWILILDFYFHDNIDFYGIATQNVEERKECNM